MKKRYKENQEKIINEKKINEKNNVNKKGHLNNNNFINNKNIKNNKINETKTSTIHLDEDAEEKKEKDTFHREKKNQRKDENKKKENVKKFDSLSDTMSKMMMLLNNPKK